MHSPFITITVFCQAPNKLLSGIYPPRWITILAFLAFCVLAGACGCALHAEAPPPLPRAHQAQAAHPDRGGHVSGVVLVAVVGGSLLAAARLLGRGRRHAGGAAALRLDREDVALLRTARDALGYLVRRRMARHNVVPLEQWRRRR